MNFVSSHTCRNSNVISSRTSTHVVVALDVGLAGGLTGAVFGGALVARIVLLAPFAVVEVLSVGARGFVNGGGPFPSLLAAVFGANFDGLNGWFVSASAMAASLRGCSFSCVGALRLSDVVVPVDDDAMLGPAMVLVNIGGWCGLSGEEERNRGRRDMAVG